MPTNINYLNDPDRVFVDAQIIKDIQDLGELAFASDESQNDLLYLKFLLVSSDSNINWDYFTSKDLLRIYKTPRDKHINWEHDHEKIIGHIKNSVITYNGSVLSDSEVEKFLKMDEPPKGKYDIYCSGVIYKSACSPFARRIIEAFGKNRGDYGYLSVSMEVLFKDWYYLVGEETYDKDYAYQFAPLHKTKKKFDGKEVFRVFKNYYFSGCGVVPKPGNTRSEILAIASEIDREIQDDEAIAIHKEISPSNLNDQELVFDHSLIHRLYDVYLKNGHVNGWSKEDIINYHILLIKEMQKREFDHKEHDKLDKDSSKFLHGANAALDVQLSTIKTKILSDFPEDIIIDGGFIKVVGSFIDGSDDFADLDVHCDLRLDIPNILKQNIKTDKDLHVIEALSSPNGNYLPLYQLVLRKNPEYSIVPSTNLFKPMDKNIKLYFPSSLVSDINVLISRFATQGDPAIITPLYSNCCTSIQVHKNDSGNVAIFAEDGTSWYEDEKDPRISLFIDSFKSSDTGAFVLLGYLTEKNIFIYDCLLHRSGDLVDNPALTRLYFAKKIVDSLGYDRTNGPVVKMADYIVSKIPVLRDNLISMFERGFDSMVIKSSTSKYDEEDIKNSVIFNPSFILGEGTDPDQPEVEEENATSKDIALFDPITESEVIVKTDESCDIYVVKDDNEYQALAAAPKEGEGEGPGAPDSFYMIPPGWTGKYVVQHHKRGKSIHTDFRLEHPNGNLFGWTLDTPGNSKQHDKFLDNNSKDRILVEKKLEQPSVWLTFEGETKPGTDTEDGLPEPGATNNYPGEFTIVDKGTFVAGISKPYFHEYFLKSEKTGTTTGRWMVRKLGLKATSLGEDSPSTKKVESWLLWKPTDQTPYGDQKGEDVPVEQKKAWDKARKKVQKMVGLKDQNFSMNIAIASFNDSNEQWIIEGYAATNDLGKGNRVITAEGLESAIRGLKGVTLYKNHDYKDEVGVVLDAALITDPENQSTKIWIKCLVSQTRPDIWQEVKEKVLHFFSIGGKATKYQWDINDENERLQLMTEFKSIEVSITGIPENPVAEIVQWYTSSVANEEEDEAMAEEIRDNESEEAVDSEQETVPETVVASEETQPQSAEGETQEAVAEEATSTPDEAVATDGASEDQTQETASAGAEESTTQNWENKYNELILRFNEINAQFQDRIVQDTVNARLQECAELGLEFSTEKTEELTGRFKQMDASAYDAWTTDLLELKQAIAALPKEVSDLMDELKKANPEWVQGKIMKEAWKQYKKTAKASEALAAAGSLSVNDFITALKKVAGANKDASLEDLIGMAMKECENKYPYPGPDGAKANVTDPLVALGGTEENTAEASSDSDPASLLDNVQSTKDGLPNIETEIKSGAKYSGFWG